MVILRLRQRSAHVFATHGYATSLGTFAYAAFYKIAGGSETLSYAVSWTNTSRGASWAIAVYSGANGSAPIDGKRCLTERPFQKRASSFQREQIRSAGRGRSFPIRLHVFFVRPFISRRPVLAKCKTDESEHHQDGSGYHQPMRIFHRGEHPSFPLRLQPSSHDQPPDQSLSTRLPIRRASA